MCEGENDRFDLGLDGGEWKVGDFTAGGGEVEIGEAQGLCGGRGRSYSGGF